MKFVRTKLILLSLSATFFACGDCIQEVSGVVMCLKTQRPLNGVVVYQKNDDFVETDSLGQFQYFGVSGGLFSCPDVSLGFKKKGYEMQSVEFPSGSNDTIWLNLFQ